MIVTLLFLWNYRRILCIVKDLVVGFFCDCCGSFFETRCRRSSSSRTGCTSSSWGSRSRRVCWPRMTRDCVRDRLRWTMGNHYHSSRIEGTGEMVRIKFYLDISDLEMIVNCSPLGKILKIFFLTWVGKPIWSYRYYWPHNEKCTKLLAHFSWVISVFYYQSRVLFLTSWNDSLWKY